MNKVTGLILVGGLMTVVAQADMNFVPIGTPGNANDVTTDAGGVAYDYSVGMHEVTSDQFSESGLGGSAGVNTPIINVSWHDAARFCNWMTTGSTSNGAYTISAGLVTGMMSRTDILNAEGLFYVLPTLDEWYKAAYFDASGGSGYSLYADGTSVAPSAGTNVNFLGAIGAEWVVGSGIDYDEQNGTGDMMGNVYEWLETAGDNPAQRLVKGGSWDSDTQSLRSSSTNPAISPNQTTNQLGFRVVAVPEPGTLSLMGLSTLGLFSTRSLRRRKLAGKSLLPVRCEQFCDAYCTQEEWHEAHSEEENYITVSVLVRDAVVHSVRLTWSTVYSRCNALTEAVWNHMADLHASRRVARKAFGKMLKKNSMACLDGFLSLFMK